MMDSDSLPMLFLMEKPTMRAISRLESRYFLSLVSSETKHSSPLIDRLPV